MKKIRTVFFISIVTMFFVAYTTISAAQDAKPRPSPKASVSQTIGVDTEITINYGRPGVKGRKIWGDLVPYGLNKGNQYSNNKDYPWRAGANENTTIGFNHDLSINGKKIPAGKYSIHMIPGESEFKIMFNKKNDAWGSYSYDAADDVVTLTEKPVKNEHTEWLEYGFEDLSDNGATAYLKWEKVKIPFKIQLAE
jgi:hypothetical protein